MNYIINPMWFYWISVIDRLKIFALCADFICVICVGVIFFVRLDACGEDEKTCTKWIHIFLALFIVLTLISIFVPSRNTLIEMMIARNATTENATTAVEAIKSAVDYIINAIQSAK